MLVLDQPFALAELFPYKLAITPTVNAFNVWVNAEEAGEGQATASNKIRAVANAELFEFDYSEPPIFLPAVWRQDR